MANFDVFLFRKTLLRQILHQVTRVVERKMRQTNGTCLVNLVILVGRDFALALRRCNGIGWVYQKGASQESCRPRDTLLAVGPQANLHRSGSAFCGLFLP